MVTLLARSSRRDRPLYSYSVFLKGSRATLNIRGHAHSWTQWLVALGSKQPSRIRAECACACKLQTRIDLLSNKRAKKNVFARKVHIHYMGFLDFWTQTCWVLLNGIKLNGRCVVLNSSNSHSQLNYVPIHPKVRFMLLCLLDARQRCRLNSVIFKLIVIGHHQYPMQCKVISTTTLAGC